MRRTCFLALFFIPFFAQALEYNIQYENEQVRVSKIKLAATEKIGLHRDEYPRLIITLKGGTYTRIEEDGTSQNIVFSTGETIFLDADPIGHLHKGENGSQELEMIVVEFKEQKNISR
jgi:quercetin dioxygenase-like cupin family protein